ncbi:hypothetical protein [Roseimicrobium sp. ORNL1]|uniref:hypothetical protein n=1 Tax=Roseimicrobium sp. ORNL1 TaxID=2711231 RepID=UPI0013E12FBF|nr:hypothetical protein [Roseimicrobium sp. ORNL1]QIF00079.1 hypothetical protein G5S37_00605 [Roseimicrobium sp. ORNL1]
MSFQPLNDLSNRRLLTACHEQGGDAQKLSELKDSLSPPDGTEEMPLKDQMDYAMKHFSFLADQRLRIFQFYAILLAASVAATLALVDKPFNLISYLICGAYHVLVSLLFLAVERRNIHLLGVARAGVHYVESKAAWPIPLRLSSIDSALTKGGLRPLGSFRVAFQVAYACQCMFGIGIIYCGAFVTHTPKTKTIAPEIERPNAQNHRISFEARRELLRNRSRSGAMNRQARSREAKKKSATAKTALHPPLEPMDSPPDESITPRTSGRFIP